MRLTNLSLCHNWQSRTVAATKSLKRDKEQMLAAMGVLDWEVSVKFAEWFLVVSLLVAAGCGESRSTHTTLVVVMGEEWGYAEPVYHVIPGDNPFTGVVGPYSIRRQRGSNHFFSVVGRDGPVYEGYLYDFWRSPDFRSTVAILIPEQIGGQKLSKQEVMEAVEKYRAHLNSHRCWTLKDR